MKMARFQSNITCHTKNQDDYTLNEKKTITDANTEMSEMLELPESHTDTSINIVNTFEKKFENAKSQLRNKKCQQRNRRNNEEQKGNFSSN